MVLDGYENVASEWIKLSVLETPPPPTDRFRFGFPGDFNVLERSSMSLISEIRMLSLTSLASSESPSASGTGTALTDKTNVARNSVGCGE